MPRLSIVIPSLEGATPLEATLASVLQNRPEDCEILVVHDGRYDDPYELRGEVRFVETTSGTLPAELVSRGCQASRGEVLHVLQPGVEIEDGWVESALAHFADPCVAAVAPLVLDCQSRDRVLSAGISYGPGGGRWIRGRGWASNRRGPTRCDVLGPTLAAAFYRRSTLKSVGGFDPSVGLVMADVEIALSLRARGYRAVLEPDCRVFATAATAAGESEFQQGKYAERVFWRHAAEIGWLASLALHPMLVASEFAVGLKRGGAITRLLGRAAACLDGGEGGEVQPPDESALVPSAVGRDKSARPSIRIDTAHDRRGARPEVQEQRERAA